MSIKSAHQRQSGFSLVELLMTIAIIGVMGSIAVAALGNQTDSVTKSRDQRNAQEMAAICTAAHAAGLDFVAGNQLDAAVRKIIQGAAPVNGPFKNHVFKLNLIGEAEIAGAMQYLRIQNGELLYNHDA